MIDAQSYAQLKQEIAERTLEDCGLLDKLRQEIQPLQNEVRRIQPRIATSVSLVGADGGNNTIQFDPFLIQLIRVVDSANNEYCLEAITPTTDISKLSDNQFYEDGTPRTALGKMMAYLGVSHLTKLCQWIRLSEGQPVSPSWVRAYRDLVEWAILFTIIREKDFGTDTLVVHDGLLRSKVFAGELFYKYRQGLDEGIERHKRNRRKIYLAGVAKNSKVLSRYRLAMALEGILTTDYPAYVEIPREIEQEAYVWSEYARGDEEVIEGGEINKYVAGKMFFVKFGDRPRDPIWPVDIYLPQVPEVQTILGYMLADAINGFPVPMYPLCLQKAHENAAMVDFDFYILQDQIFEGIRAVLGDEAPSLDIFRLQDLDPAQARYQ